MKLFIVLFLSMFTITNAFAKESLIKGEVLNGKTNEPVTSATSVLYNMADSSMAKIAVTDANGNFSFDHINPGKYFITISSVGYETRDLKSFEVKSGEEVQIGKVMLHQVAEVLKGIVVSAKKPMIERKIDKLVFNVESSLTSSGSSALELLEKAPGVTVDKDGNISMRGKSGVMVLIDDRPSYLSKSELANYLKTLPASMIDQLEIMTNPSAKYDASGNAGIINIKTKKNKSYGLNGNVSASGMYSSLASGNGSLNINYRAGKVNLFGTYSYSQYNGKNNSYISRHFRNPETHEVESIIDQINENRYHSESNNLKVGMDYYAGKNTIAGIVLSGYHADRLIRGTNPSSLKAGDGQVDSMLVSRNYNPGITDNFSVNANLRHSFDSTGKKMTADLDYIIYDQSQNMSYVTDYFLPDGSVQRPSAHLFGETPSTIQIYSGKIDFTLPVKKIGKIEAGLKASLVETDNDALYKNRTPKGDEIDIGKTNHFIYKENILAGYLSWSKQVKKWGFQAGLRAENTQSTGRQLGNAVIPDSSFTKDYLNLFPTVYVSFQSDKKNSFGLNYGRRIERPDYGDLNPFLYFLDEYTYQAGNVYLQPQFTDQVELSHNFKGLIHSSINYSHVINAITQVLRQNTEKRITFQTTDNLANKTSWVLSTGSNFKTGKKFNSSIDVSLGHDEFEGQLTSGYLKTSGWLFSGRMSEQVKFGKGWSSELSGFYRSKAADGQIVMNAMWRVDASVQKSILKDKGSINFFVRDIFNSQIFSGKIQSGDIDLDIRNERVNRTFGISFKYRFGKPIKNLKQHSSGSASDEQNRVKSN